uniref:Uncharacterized protein n=1 Tax=Echinococcus granulosus TaxID=6210 RepID=A0A068WJ25_ECHGR|nr:hypothetical protein EgrG_001037100 [Echinococcus granulosus]
MDLLVQSYCLVELKKTLRAVSCRCLLLLLQEDLEYS